MRKLIFTTLFFILISCWLHGQAEAQDNPFGENWKKMSERAWQIQKEFDRQVWGEESDIEYNEDVYFRALKSWFRDVYPFRDTIGSQQLFERVLSPQLQKAVRNTLETTENLCSVMEICILEKDGEHYCYITPAVVAITGDGDGYLLYQNKVLVEIRYESKALAELVMKPDELKEMPYDQFLPIGGEFWIATYDGPSDYYRIGRKGKLKFIGRLDYWEKLSRDLQRIMYKRRT